MSTTFTAGPGQDLAASQTGLSRFFGDVAALFDSTVAIFTEAFDLSSAARARFPSAD